MIYIKNTKSRYGLTLGRTYKAIEKEGFYKVYNDYYVWKCYSYNAFQAAFGHKSDDLEPAMS